MKIGVSACLLGHNVRYNGSNKRNDELIKLLEGTEIIPVCPECEAGLPIPHLPIEILNGKVIDPEGKEYTDELIAAGNRIYDRVKDCDFLVLKSKSPTCGLGKIYDGTFNSILIEGNGTFTELCLANGIKVFSELDLQEIEELLKK